MAFCVAPIDEAVVDQQPREMGGGQIGLAVPFNELDAGSLTLEMRTAARRSRRPVVGQRSIPVCPNE